MTQVVNLDCPAPDTATIPEGTRRIVNGEERVLYDGYWIRPTPCRRIRWKPRNG